MVEIARHDGGVQILDVFDGAQPMSTPFRPNASRLRTDDVVANQNVVQISTQLTWMAIRYCRQCTLKRIIADADAMRRGMVCVSLP